MSTDVMIHADKLTKMFGSLTALDRVSFEVRRGEVVGFLGPNGAGKSTTMRILTCFISPTAGTAKIHGFDVFDNPLEVRQKIGYLPQRAPLYSDMTVWSYLEFAASMRGLETSEFKKSLRKAVEICGIAKVLGKDISTLSHGYRQRVGLAQALIHNPPILILDEPTSDLDPNEKAEVISYIREIGKERTVLLSTHNLSEVETACARAVIVSRGRVVADGPLEDIRGKGGRVTYRVSVDEKNVLNGGHAPSDKEAREALVSIKGVTGVKEIPSTDKAHAFDLTGEKDGDIRADIYRMIAQKGWIMLELHRDAQSLGDVFRDLTHSESRSARGLRAEVDEVLDEKKESVRPSTPVKKDSVPPSEPEKAPADESTSEKSDDKKEEDKES